MTRILLVLLAACAGGSDPKSTDDTGGTGVGGACELAATHQSCPECDDGPVTCTFGDTSVTRTSCGDCQARAALHQALCDADEPAASSTIEADTVCEPAGTTTSR
jgi:hypothetical protein